MRLMGATLFAASLLSSLSAASADAPRFSEMKWPFLIDQWGLGRAFECKAADCGLDVKLYLRAKVGFCNCTTGVADDEEIERVSDLNLFGTTAQGRVSGAPVAVGWMKGRSRPFVVVGGGQPPRFATTIAVSNKCDAIVVTVVANRALSPDIERAAVEFLGSAPLLNWAKANTGL